MRAISTFNVRPSLPEPIRPLLRIAYNLCWSWDRNAIDLFRRLDRDLWESTGHNPVLLLGKVDQSVLESTARDESFLAHLKEVSDHLDVYLSGERTWYRREHPSDENMQVAYFSAEFGITECLTIFAGGLGVLAGDHLKASSDLGLPLIGVGLLYQQGYFHQHMNAAGWQQESFEENDFHTMPLRLVPNLTVRIELPDGPVIARVWSVHVGRLKLFLLDTNVMENKPEHRRITDRLYGGDLEMRIKQEILLGIGGYRALDALGLEPTVYHMNEGHSAFLGIERTVRLMETRGLSFHEARLLASASLVFTTHTPVPAGHDYFSPELVDRYFSSYFGRLGISRTEFLGLGRQNPNNESESFCMTVLALRLASFSNGVSELHGKVSRNMWRQIWPGIPESEIPIRHVTNGVHACSWVSHEMNQLYDRYLGPKWREEPADPKLWERTQSIPAGELWRSHERRRERLVAYARERLRDQLTERNASESEIGQAEEVLTPEALTIGFGRRFASYKRATLLLRDPDRLARLLNHPQRPVQIIFAGKAHPQDDQGKRLIQTIIEFANRPDLRRRIVFLQNYDMAMARYMVQGCDIWLNTPLRPLEASGTSGMKAQANGVLNVSTLDGWWDEAWRMRPMRRKADQQPTASSDLGWAIGGEEISSDPAQQDRMDAEALYDLLERDVVPRFYERGPDGLPRQWIWRMKVSVAKLCPVFNMQRTVMQYSDESYVAAHRRYLALSEQGCARAKHLAAWLTRVESAWSQIRVEAVSGDVPEVDLGDQVRVAARVSLPSLAEDDVFVELIAGRVNAAGEITEPTVFPMNPQGRDDSGCHRFDAVMQAGDRSGLHGYAIRVLPRHPDSLSRFWPGLITWANQGPSPSHDDAHAGAPREELEYHQQRR